MTRERKRTAFGAAAAGFLLLVVLPLWFRRADITRWPQADGTELRLLQATQGARHQLVVRKRWRDGLYPLLPASLAVRLGAKVLTHSPTDTNAVVLWLRYTHAGTPLAAVVPPLPCRLTIVDDQGREAAAGAGRQSIFQVATNARIHAVEITAFPRRAGAFHLRVYGADEHGGWVRLGECSVAHRPLRPRGEWTAEPLPARRLTNDLTVLLDRCTTGGGGNPWSASNAPMTRLGFRLLDHGSTTQDWVPMVTQIEAATGERRSVFSSGRWVGDGLSEVAFPGALWAEEPAWRVRVRLLRSDHFLAAEIWEVRHLPRPAPRKIFELNARTNLFGELIEVLGVSLPRASLPSEWDAIPGETCLHSRTPTPLPGMRFVLLAVRDDRGREVPVRGSRAVESTGGRGGTMREINYAHALDLAPDWRWLDARYGLLRDREVEFVVHPDAGR